MPLHERDAVRQQLEDCVFAGRDLTRPVPKYRFPGNETQAREAFQVVSDELMLDGNARQNLATFCQTWAEPELLALMALSVNKNMIDKDEYPQTAEVERRCVHMLADLWHAPHAANTVGASAIGSSEACMLAGMAAKWRWRAKRQAEGKPTDQPNMVCGPVQVVWHKFARWSLLTSSSRWQLSTPRASPPRAASSGCTCWCRRSGRRRSPRTSCRRLTTSC